MQALRFTGKGDGLTGRLEREQQGLAPHSATRVSVEKEPLANGYAEMGRGSDGALVWLEKKRGKGRNDLRRWLCSNLNIDMLCLAAAFLTEYISDFGELNSLLID
jgi:hypothetical protein